MQDKTHDDHRAAAASTKAKTEMLNLAEQRRGHIVERLSGALSEAVIDIRDGK